MKVRILGGAQIGASCLEVTFNDTTGSFRRILLDAGVVPSTKEPHLPPSGPVDGVIVTHAHFDHIGNVPMVFYNNSHGWPAWLRMSRPTAYLSRLNWLDTLNIHIRESKGNNPEAVAFLNKYSAGLEMASRSLKKLDKGGREEIFPGVFATYGSAGHLSGAIWVAIEAEGKTTVFTGDWSFQDRPTVRGTDLSELPKNIDALFMDSTNGIQEPPLFASECERMLRDVSQDLAQKRTVLMATLQFGRLPDLTVLLAQNGIDSYVDGSGRESLRETIGPNGKWDHTVDINFENEPRYLNDGFSTLRVGDGRIRLMESDFQRRGLIKSKNGQVIIAPSGMFVGGRSVQYSRIFLADPEARVYLTSFQAEGTPGRELKNKIQTGGTVTMKDAKGQSFKVPIKALVRDYNFSSHAAGSELIEAVRRLSPKETFLIHGDDNAKMDLQDRLYDDLGYDLASIPQEGDDVEI